MRRPKSDIPPGAVEQIVSEAQEIIMEPESEEESGKITYPARAECRWQGELVGYRFYLKDGTLLVETPLKDGQKHGREYRWSWPDGKKLESVEPYVAGKLHGTAKQYSPQSGKVIGRYTFVHGTGFDIWRSWCGDRADGQYAIAEIHSYQNGFHQGYDWWLNADQQSVWDESHWHADQKHGIERCWNQVGKLSRGYPKYWLHGEPVTKRQYIRAAQTDQTLPPFCEQDNLPQRSFPPSIQRLLSASRKCAR